MTHQKTLANLAKVRETGSTWEFHILRIDTWGYLAQRKLYNKYLLELTSRNMSYNNFCEAVVRAGKETAVAIDWKCKGWYTASKDSGSLNPTRDCRHQDATETCQQMQSRPGGIGKG